LPEQGLWSVERYTVVMISAFDQPELAKSGPMAVWLRGIGQAIQEHVVYVKTASC